MEPNSQVIDPKVATPAPNAQPAVVDQKPLEDVLKRVSQYKPEAKKVDGVAEDVAFDYKEIEKITDPTARAIAEKAYKSMQSGFTKKFQEVADLRKSLESQASQKKVWTAEAIQKELLSDPTFVSEAQRLQTINPNPSNPTNSGMTDTEWSALTEQEKAKFQLLENKISTLEQQRSETLLQQQHQALQSKYANYAPDFVNTTVKEVLQGRKQITLEDVWKATDYENAVQRAYELGKADATGKVVQKQQSSSFDGGQATNANPPPEIQKGETNQSFFQRIARGRLAEAKTAVR